jgi:hypothetical protein
MNDAKRSWARMVGAVALLCMLTGCPPKQNQPVPDESTRAMADAVSQSYPIDIDTLAAILTPVMVDMHWGLVKLDNQITALRATALTDDDRTVEIHAQTASNGIDVQVRVGHFGDRVTEQQFLNALRVRANAQAKRLREAR